MVMGSDPKFELGFNPDPESNSFIAANVEPHELIYHVTTPLEPLSSESQLEIRLGYGISKHYGKISQNCRPLIQDLRSGLDYYQSEIDRLGVAGYAGTTELLLQTDYPLVQTAYLLKTPTEMDIRKILIEFIAPQMGNVEKTVVPLIRKNGNSTGD